MAYPAERRSKTALSPKFPKYEPKFRQLGRREVSKNRLHALRASMAPVVYENEESLISACRQALLVDPDVSPAALLEIVGEGSGAPIWASGQKISLNSVKKAQRVARTRLDAEQAARDAAARRSLGARPVHGGARARTARAEAGGARGK